jgi:hypothetical protein
MDIRNKKKNRIKMVFDTQMFVVLIINRLVFYLSQVLSSPIKKNLDVYITFLKTVEHIRNILSI